jgi:hypothetical protein
VLEQWHYAPRNDAEVVARRINELLAAKDDNVPS